MNDLVLLLPALALGITLICALYFGRDFFLGRYEKDKDWIRTTALRFSPEPVNDRVWCWIYYGGFALILLALIYFIPSIIVALFIWVLLLFVPGILIEILWKQRRAKIDQQLPPTIASMANSIKAGLTLVQAIERLGEQAPDPIRTEFKTMANQYSFGSDLETVIRDAKQRLDLPNFTLFASALLLNREMGGDVSQTLHRISLSLDKLHQMRKTVEAHTAEGRTNIKVLLLAPFFMLGLIAIIDPEGVKDLFRTPQGYFILMVAAILAGTGAYIASRITKSDI